MPNGEFLDPGIYEGKEDKRVYYVSKAHKVWNERGDLIHIMNFNEFSKAMNFLKYVPSLEEFKSFLYERSLEYKVSK